MEHSQDDERVRDHLANERTYLAWVRTGIATIQWQLDQRNVAFRMPFYGGKWTKHLLGHGIGAKNSLTQRLPRGAAFPCEHPERHTCFVLLPTTDCPDTPYLHMPLKPCAARLANMSSRHQFLSQQRRPQIVNLMPQHYPGILGFLLLRGGVPVRRSHLLHPTQIDDVVDVTHCIYIGFNHTKRQLEHRRQRTFSVFF